MHYVLKRGSGKIPDPQRGLGYERAVIIYCNSFRGFTGLLVIVVGTDHWQCGLWFGTSQKRKKKRGRTEKA
mgnify:CR=1 FL=1